MARSRHLRKEPAATRADVARLAVRTIGGLRLWRRLVPSAKADVVRELVECAATATSERIDEVLAAVDDPDERFAVEYALPDWVVPHLRAAFGDACAVVARSLLDEPPRTLRVNTLRCRSRQQLCSRLRRDGIEAYSGQLAATAVHVVGRADVFRTAAFRDGWFEQQDEASQMAVAMVAPPPRGRILDLCCGSGGKALALAAALANGGVVLATDVHRGRLRALRSRLARAGADNVRPLLLDGSPASEAELEAFARTADRILIDAPCSGTGSWRRRPEARWNVDGEALTQLLATQRRLLDRCARWLRPRARLIYATCSLLPVENERQVLATLAAHRNLEVVRGVEILGGRLGHAVCDEAGKWLQLRPDRHGCDGFFAAVLRAQARN